VQDGRVEPEDFTSKLQKELKSSPQPYLVPFLKVNYSYRTTSCRQLDHRHVAIVHVVLMYCLLLSIIKTNRFIWSKVVRIQGFFYQTKLFLPCPFKTFIRRTTDSSSSYWHSKGVMCG